MPKIIHVAVGVIVSIDNDSKTQYFLTKRLENVHQGNKWEFPGGKVEKDESVAQALARELKEEIDIEVLTCQPLITIKHTYPEKQVCLDVFIVDNYLGEPSAQEGQGEGWFSLNQLQQLDFPEANKGIIAELVKQELVKRNL